MTLLLSSNDVQKVLTMQEAINLVERGFIELGNGYVNMPQRPVIVIAENNGMCAVMPALVSRMGALSIKTVTAFKDNKSRGMQTIFGTIILLDPETGIPLSILEAGYLTAVRTGAASAVASKYLARSNAHVAGLLGAGVQARTQLEAICMVRDITEVRVFDHNQQQVTRFASEMAGHGPIPHKIKIVGSPREAVMESDIVVTATTSASPVFDGDDLLPGTHINNIGSHAPKAREVDSKTVIKSKIVCDSVEACLVEAGDLLIPMEESMLTVSDIHGSLADIVAGKLVGRENDEEVTLFKSVGLAFQDAVVALHAYKQAKARGIGSKFDFQD